MAEKQQQKKSNKKKSQRDKNFAPNEELQLEENVDANGGEVKDDDDEKDGDDEKMASDDETDEERKKKELKEKRLLEEAIVELEKANIEHDNNEEENVNRTRELTEEEIELARAEAEKDLQMFREDKDNALSEMDEDAAEHLWRTLRRFNRFSLWRIERATPTDSRTDVSISVTRRLPNRKTFEHAKNYPVHRLRFPKGQNLASSIETV